MHDLIVGVPCSKIHEKSAVPCTREDEAVAFAAGAKLAGRSPLVFMQNSGLGNCIDTITSLLKPYGIRLKFLISHRDWPHHHAFMGSITKELIKLLQLNAQLSGSQASWQTKLSLHPPV